jgi:two-component system, NarL family, nitrate/nitrite response regulator NarL
MGEARYEEGTSSHSSERRGDPNGQTTAGAEQAPRSIMIVSDIRFFREGIAEVLQRDGAFVSVGLAADVDQALAVAAAATPQIVLIDVSLPDGLAALPRLRNLAPPPQVVALALGEIETSVIAWAEAGACGYVPRNTPLSELVSLLEEILSGQQTCSKKIAAGLLRWISRSPRAAPLRFAVTPSLLTIREEQVLQLIAAGLSNKEIARRLNIGLGTTKTHVHNLLRKLELTRRSQVARWMRANPSFGLPQEVAPVVARSSRVAASK